jgi:hypothetical protein
MVLKHLPVGAVMLVTFLVAFVIALDQLSRCRQNEGLKATHCTEAYKHTLLKLGT